MTPMKVHEVISEAVDCFVADYDCDIAANAIIGALAKNGYAIVQVDPEVVRRVLAEMYKKY